MAVSGSRTCRRILQLVARGSGGRPPDCDTQMKLRDHVDTQIKSGGLVVRWSGGLVVWWSSGLVVWWSGGLVVWWSDGLVVWFA